MSHKKLSCAASVMLVFGATLLSGCNDALRSDSELGYRQERVRDSAIDSAGNALGATAQATGGVAKAAGGLVGGAISATGKLVDGSTKLLVRAMNPEGN